MKFPVISIDPESGLSIPPRQFSKVLFPEPDVPIKPTRSPAASEKDTSLRTVRSPYALVRLLTRRTGSVEFEFTMGNTIKRADQLYFSVGAFAKIPLGCFQ